LLLLTTKGEAMRLRKLWGTAVIIIALCAGAARATVGDGQINLSGIFHDTFSSYYRPTFGAVPAGATVKLRLRVAQNDIQNVFLRQYLYNPATGQTSGPVDAPLNFLETRNEGGTNYDVWEINYQTPAAPTIVYYKFRIADASASAFYADSHNGDFDNLGQGGDGLAAFNEPFHSFQITVYDPAFTTPDWLKNAVVYQIFPDRFRNGDTTNDYCRVGASTGCPVLYGNPAIFPRTTWNDLIGDPRSPGLYQGAYGNQFYGGDLKGVQDKLDYLQNLGFDTIYLNPIFAARSNHRYDADNYFEIDPALGGQAAFDNLARAVQARGMRLILDGVWNHASSDSLYFDRYHRYATDGGCESLSSQWRSFFIFSNSVVPCNSQSYPGWFGFDGLPQFVDESPQVRDFFYRSPNSVTKYWYDKGASGWRFDVAPDISHNWWHDYRPFAKQYKADGPLIGEIFDDASQWLAGDQLDAVMNYRFRKNVMGFARGAASWSDNDNNGANFLQALTPAQFDRALKAVREDYPLPAQAAMLNLLDSHDVNRALYVLTEQGDNGLAEAKERLKLAATFQFTYLGAPMVYYGDEVALNAPSRGNGANGPEDDPYNRAPYPWADEAGDPAIYGPADNCTANFYRTLARVRREHPALRTGDFNTILTGDTTPAATDDNTYAFVRAGSGEKVLVAFNNGATSNAATLPVSAFFADGTQFDNALSGATYAVSGGNVALTLPPRGSVILLPRSVAAGFAQFSLPVFTVTEHDKIVTVQVTRSGDVSGAASVDYATGDDTAVESRDYTYTSGTLRFAAGETSKTFTVVVTEDGYASEGTEELNLTLSNPVGTALGARPAAKVRIFDSFFGLPPNPIDDAGLFVRQQYSDFLSREPDAGGLDYWTGQITVCGANAACVHDRRIGVSAAFFIELEFQETGSYVYRFYRASYGARPAYAQFLPDRARIVGGAELEQSKQSFADGWVARPAFLAEYPATLPPAEFVNRLFDRAGLTGPAYDAARQAQIQAMLTNCKTRAQVLRDVIEIPQFRQREFNPAFVLMQYFGYLRRDPDEGGYQFWLGLLNQQPANARGMVCAFITAAEYQLRFSPTVTRTNADC
jgi:glycosidase